LTSNLESLAHLWVRLAKVQRHMILAGRVGQNTPSEHKSPSRFLRDYGPQKLAAISPGAGNTNDSFLIHNRELSQLAHTTSQQREFPGSAADIH
ncbi:MAG TPA: hypothetical protein VGE39_20285, partial [Prosthecobacter sp.]